MRSGSLVAERQSVVVRRVPPEAPQTQQDSNNKMHTATHSQHKAVEVCHLASAVDVPHRDLYARMHALCLLPFSRNSITAVMLLRKHYADDHACTRHYNMIPPPFHHYPQKYHDKSREFLWLDQMMLKLCAM
jgi:hypothetical protein